MVITGECEDDSKPHPRRQVSKLVKCWARRTFLPPQKPDDSVLQPLLGDTTGTDDHLLVEYQVCQDVANHEAGTIWQFAVVLFPLLAIGAVFFLTACNDCGWLVWLPFIPAWVVLVAWDRFTQARQIVRRLMFRRQAEIEKKLHLHKGQIVDTFGQGETGANLLNLAAGLLALLWLLAATVNTLSVFIDA